MASHEVVNEGDVRESLGLLSDSLDPIEFAFVCSVLEEVVERRKVNTEEAVMGWALPTLCQVTQCATERAQFTVEVTRFMLTKLLKHYVSSGPEPEQPVVEKSVDKRLDAPVNITAEEQQKVEFAYDEEVIRTEVKKKQKKVKAKKIIAPEEMVLEREESGTKSAQDVLLENFDISFGGNVLLEASNLRLVYGRNYVLVGRNGAGKSTLLRHIAGREIMGIPKSMSILHVEQEAVGDDTIALNSVLAADVEREQLLSEEKQILARNAERKENDSAQAKADDARLAKIYTRLQYIEADAQPARAASILGGLGFTSSMQQRATKEFSGGWRMRLALARALFCTPDLLLLDEPTNMLDIPAVLWLESYLSSWKKTILCVSHSRAFINCVATDVVHLSSKSLRQYPGNYENFERLRTEALKNQKRAFEAQQAQRKHIQKFVDRWRYNAKRASLAQSRIKILQRMELIPAICDEPTVTFSFPKPQHISGALIEFQNVNFKYEETLPYTLQELNFTMNMDSRVALVGSNGTGKSTLLKLITGDNEPSDGYVIRHNRLRIGKFSQHHVDQLDLSMNALEFFAHKSPGHTSQEYRAHLGRYGVTGPLALQKLSTLSGGQKSRVAFSMVGWGAPQLLVLDEPTNHLDVETVDVLGHALNMFDGAVILVSHDERLITTVCTDLWVCGEGRVAPFPGDFEAYKKTIEVEFL
eukprot:CAMPEP_0201490926 /NCGR_PEP_ID=MMETSP0151_2-20130828/27965_1 /ASSEMBLY_ACC=CAM_ASM_000257 /TAXON_ID=200890 /ORGANISM="Paramoeba atlantica, Strain 621/1 / CCAP 1560/9" /LENGTH=699 /DNA_ID=CAMNT_0047877067 /DNA_START=30 /DNA_END=2129 /DNA_ORIENTATION=+